MPTYYRNGQLFNIYLFGLVVRCWRSLILFSSLCHWVLFCQVRLVSPHIGHSIFEVIQFIPMFPYVLQFSSWKFKVAIIIIKMTRASVLLSTRTLTHTVDPIPTSAIEWLCLHSPHQLRFIFGEATLPSGVTDVTAKKGCHRNQMKRKFGLSPCI